MGSSRLDRVYRSLVLSKFFVKGWGNPENIKRLFDFRKVVCDREKCIKLVDPAHPVTITKEEDYKNYKLLEGHFQSPFAQYVPDLVPIESHTAHFQILLPKQWKWSNNHKPMVVQLAGTGDHYFWRRRLLMGKPLLGESNIGSIILENPFYGLRKPKEQKRSCLHNVSDIFVMGGCLVLESIVLFHWCERNGLGPLGITGVSMGGHMASLAASSWPKPVVLVPCLSWSTAAGVFTYGVMSGAIDWSMLENQYFKNQIYNEILQMVMRSPYHDECAFDAGRHFAQSYSRSLANQIDNSTLINPGVNERLTAAVEETFRYKQSKLSTLPVPEKWKTIGSAIKQLPESSSSAPWMRLIQPFFDEKSKSMQEHQKDRARQQAIEFMRGIMNEFTHIANYSQPVDCSSIIIVTASEDAYVPRAGATDLSHLWPGCEIRYVDTGHVGAYILHHPIFRKAVKDAFDKLIAKHHS